MTIPRFCRLMGVVGGLLLAPTELIIAQQRQPLPDSLQRELWGNAQATHYLDRLPELPGGGGAGAILEQIMALVETPAEVHEGRVDGRLFLTFVVDSQGIVTRARVIRSLSPACDAAALAALARLPLLVPTQNNGRSVAAPLTLPIVFYGPDHAYESGQLTQRARFPKPGLKAYVRQSLRKSGAQQSMSQPGIVEVSFVVGADGQVRDGRLDGVINGRGYEQEVLHLVQAMPTWQPACNAQRQPVAMREYMQVALPALTVMTGYPATFKPGKPQNTRGWK